MKSKTFSIQKGLVLSAVLTALLCIAPISINNRTAKAVACESRPIVYAGGTPFGIKIRSEGVMVISVADKSPAQRAGIKAGDIITIVNDRKVTTNAELSAAIQMSLDTSILLRRGDTNILFNFKPQSENGFLKIGAFVRDSAAGIGTLTFCQPETNTFGGLGHAVSDISTGGAIPLGSGEITSAQIYDVVKGKEGNAGELCGIIIPDSDIGAITSNTEVGIFGTLSETFSDQADNLFSKPVPVAYRKEIKTGSATVLTTANGNSPEEYSIEIERLNLLDTNGSKAMVIRITDERLLSQTGGIVRGMSGSPILQNGRLVGAVTHVFVNDPTRGYAVFADTMLSKCSVIDG